MALRTRVGVAGLSALPGVLHHHWCVHAESRRRPRMDERIRSLGSGRRFLPARKRHVPRHQGEGPQAGPRESRNGRCRSTSAKPRSSAFRREAAGPQCWSRAWRHLRHGDEAGEHFGGLGRSRDRRSGQPDDQPAARFKSVSFARLRPRRRAWTRRYPDASGAGKCQGEHRADAWRTCDDELAVHRAGEFATDG